MCNSQMEKIFVDQYRRGYINGCEDTLKKIEEAVRHFMFVVNPSSSESDYACNYILDLINKKMGKESEE